MQTDPAARFDIQIAEIIRVDPIEAKVDLQFMSKVGGRTSVNITWGSAGKRHMSGTMPVEGDLAIVGWMRFMRKGTYPIILGYIPNGWFSGLKFDPIRLLGGDRSGLDEGIAATMTYDQTLRHRFRQLYSGEHLTSSHEGAELFMDRGVHLMSRSLGEFMLRDTDETAILRTLNAFTSLASGRYKRGLVERSAMLFDHDVVVINGEGVVPEEYNEGEYPGEYPTAEGNVRVYRGRDELVNANLLDDTGQPFSLINKATVFPYQLLEDGRKYHIVTDHGGRADTTAPGEYTNFVEDRMEMPHKSDGVVEVSREVDGFDADQRRFYIERVYGTVVGNEASDPRERAQYGKVLRPVIFANTTDGVGSARARVEVCDPKHYDSLAAAYLYRMRPPAKAARGEFGSDLMLAHDKDGCFYANFPASSSNNPMGPGWSMLANLDGGLKATIGASASGDSIDVQCVGSIKLRPGNNRQDGTGLGFDVASAFQIVARGRDFNGISWFRRAVGDAVEQTEGNDSRIVSGSRLDRVDGAIRQECSRKSIHVSNGYSLKSGKGADEVIIGLRKFVITPDLDGGGMAREILGQPGQVADDEVIAAGGKSLSILGGGYEMSIIGGDLKASVIGKVAIDALGGNLEMSSVASVIVRGTGGLDLQSTASASLTAQGPLTLQSSSSASLLAPQITLGNSPSGGCAIGTPGPGGPHIDYITGVPIRGSLVVQCS
jgi:hypothetical protein